MVLKKKPIAAGQAINLISLGMGSLTKSCSVSAVDIKYFLINQNHTAFMVFNKGAQLKNTQNLGCFLIVRWNAGS